VASIARAARHTKQDPAEPNRASLVAAASEPGPAAVIAGLDALAQETRLAAFRRLPRAGASGMPQGELARSLAVPPQTPSFHLRQISQAGIVGTRRGGTTIRYAELPPPPSERVDDGIAFHVHAREGLTLVFWPEADVLCVLVSDGEPEALLQLAFAKAMKARTSRS
jgi:DNA-binding transcriptional ArsR family regulator